MSLRFVLLTLIEFGPLTLFFFISALWGFYPGATALVLSTAAAMAYSILVFKHFAYFSVSVSALTLLFGIATIYLHEPVWLVLEFTISSLLFSGLLFFSWTKDHPLLKDFFGHMFSITHVGWMTLTYRWAWAFLLIGTTNQVFWYLYPAEHLWTTFRFVTTLLTFIFGMSQLTVSKRERLPDSSKWGLKK